MAIVKIKITDVGADGDHFEVYAESYPEITEEQADDITKLTLAQYAALKIVEFVTNGLEVTARKTHNRLLKNAHKSDKGFH